MPLRSTREMFDARLRLIDAAGSELDRFQATFEIREDAIGIQPASGASSELDFAQVDFLLPGDHRFCLALEGGERLEFSMLGRRFDEACEALCRQLRDFQNTALLLDEAEGGERFEGTFQTAGARGAAELRLYFSRLSIFPREHVPFAIALGEVEQAIFDRDTYAVELLMRSGERAIIGQLGRATEAFFSLLEARLASLRCRLGDAIGALLPDLPFLKKRQLAALLPDGVPASKRALDGIAPALWDCLLEAILAPELAEAVHFLSARALPGEQAMALKEVHGRLNLDSESDDGEGEPSPSAQSARVHLGNHLAFFLFPILAPDRSLPGNAIAVEVASRTGRATYLFRLVERTRYGAEAWEVLVPTARHRIAELAQALVSLGFRRTPIHLSEAAFREPRHRNLRLALRHAPGLSAARSSFLGRAIHGPGWQQRIEALLACGSER